VQFGGGGAAVCEESGRKKNTKRMWMHNIFVSRCNGDEFHSNEYAPDLTVNCPSSVDAFCPLHKIISEIKNDCLL
jgi:hypothetical protein